LRPLIGLLYPLWKIDNDDGGVICRLNDWQQRLKYSEETCPSAALSSTNPTLLDPNSNPGLPPGKPATDRLVYGMAINVRYFVLNNRKLASAVIIGKQLNFSLEFIFRKRRGKNESCQCC
jgi:hypothetical protein